MKTHYSLLLLPYFVVILKESCEHEKIQPMENIDVLCHS